MARVYHSLPQLWNCSFGNLVVNKSNKNTLGTLGGRSRGGHMFWLAEMRQGTRTPDQICQQLGLDTYAAAAAAALQFRGWPPLNVGLSTVI